MNRASSENNTGCLLTDPEILALQQLPRPLDWGLLRPQSITAMLPKLKLGGSASVALGGATPTQTTTVPAGAPPLPISRLSFGGGVLAPAAPAETDGVFQEDPLQQEVQQYSEAFARYAESVVDRLLRNKRCAVFAEPVDLVAFPSYLATVKQPMDLSTVKAVRPRLLPLFAMSYSLFVPNC